MSEKNIKDPTNMNLSELKEQLFTVENFDYIAVFAECAVDDTTELQAEEIYNFIGWSNPDTFQDIMEMLVSEEEFSDDFQKIPATATLSVLTNPNSTL